MVARPEAPEVAVKVQDMSATSVPGEVQVVSSFPDLTPFGVVNVPVPAVPTLQLWTMVSGPASNWSKASTEMLYVVLGATTTNFCGSQLWTPGTGAPLWLGTTTRTMFGARLAGVGAVAF